MTALINNKVTISRNDFLDSFIQLYHAIKDYDELINLVSDATTQDPQEIKRIIKSRISQLEFGSVNVKAMEIIGTYLKSTLKKFKGEKLTFLIPDHLEDGFFTLNDGYMDLSKSIQKVEEELREIEEKVFYLVRLLPPHNVGKIQLLLKAISSFFKSIVRKDFLDMEGHINHIHYLTASKESYLVINDIGRMVRDIYNSLQDFSAHVEIEELEPNLVDEMPDAIDKLNLVIKRMEESANSTLDDVEALLDSNSKKLADNNVMLEKCRFLEKQLVELKEKHGEGVADDIDSVIDGLKSGILDNLKHQADELKEEEAQYFDIMSNQSFQDITGQTLKKIIGFIEQLEFKLLQILQKYSGRFQATKPKIEDDAVISPLFGVETKDGIILHGPRDNKETGKEVAKQDDVDKVLAEFGF